MKPIFLLLFCLLSAEYAAALDTLYLDAYRVPIIKAGVKPAYFKVVNKTDTGYVVEYLKANRALESKTTFKDADLRIKDGYDVYYTGNTLGHEGRYLNGKHEGLWKYYHQGGAISGVVVYKNDVISTAEYFKPNGEKETDPKKIEQLPSFPGGIRAMSSYIGRTLRYPPQARENAISGRVQVGFTITATGEIRDIRIVQGVSNDLNREAIRIVEGMPRWIPGVQFNRPVNVAYVFPVFFMLN